MTSQRVWVNEPSRRWAWLVGALVIASALLFVMVVAAVWRNGPDDRRAAAPIQAAATLPVESPRPQEAPVVSAAARPAQVQTQPALACAYQRLQIELPAGKTSQACVSATQISQAGDVRIYIVQAQGISEWSLRIDAGAEVVLAASLSKAGHGTYRCEEAHCAGISIGPRDAHGQRTIEMDGAALMLSDGQPESSVDAAAETVRISARLQTPSDQHDPALACSGPSISIVESRGGVLAVCPSSGGSVAIMGEGRRVFGMRSRAGDAVLVGVDAAGAVDLVQFGGLECTGVSCGGATTQPVNDGGDETGRVFSFSGTSLSDGRPGGRTATLNGSAVLSHF